MKYKRFSKEAFKEAHSFKISTKLAAQRQIVNGYTIDGPESKDLDDGIYITKTKEGYKIEVSIVDIAELITKDSTLFEEALDRVETKYLPKFNFPMLPKVLSENKLSLLPGDLKPAVTYTVEIDKNADIIDFSLKETAFRNIRKTTYEEFDQIANENKYNPDNQLFREMYFLADSFMKKRRNKGALAIYDLKKGIYTSEEGIIQPIPKQKANKGHIVVQEFMILANKAFCKYCIENNIPILFRNHEPRRSAPDRDEILQQLEFALSNQNYIASLMERSSLWFQRADYGPILKGHFGLNEPAYTHSTSPIRRVADLINHQQIKAFLNDEKLPYTINQLWELSENINNKIEQQKKEVKDHQIKIADKKARSNLEKASSEELRDLDYKDLLRVVTVSIRENNLPENLELAVKRNIENDNFFVNFYYTVLVENPFKSDKWDDIKKLAIEKISRKQGFSVQVLNMMHQQGDIHKLDIGIEPSEDNFTAKVKAMIAEDTIESDQSITAPNKKEALHFAAVDFLLQMPGIPEIERDEVIPQFKHFKSKLTELKRHFEEGIPEEEKKPEAFDKNKNYIGLLLEYSQQNIIKKEPEYSFEASGEDHDLTFICIAEAEVNRSKHKVEAKGTNKKEAKSNAAANLFELLDEKNLLHDTQKKKKHGANKNPVSQFIEYFQKNSLDLPDFEFEKEGYDNEAVFICSVYFSIDGKKYNTEGRGKSKKESKKAAALKALQNIQHEK